MWSKRSKCWKWCANARGKGRNACGETARTRAQRASGSTATQDGGAFPSPAASSRYGICAVLQTAHSTAGPATSVLFLWLSRSCEVNQRHRQLCG